MSYAPTYHPGASLASEARAVAVGVGQRVSSVDIALVPGRAATLAGMARDSQGRPLQDVSVEQSFRGPAGASFSSVGNARMVNPDFKGTRPTMFICGNDAAAKSAVSGILDRFGWEVADMGAVEAARAIEPLCILWCIPGFRENSWTHALKLLR